MLTSGSSIRSLRSFKRQDSVQCEQPWRSPGLFVCFLTVRCVAIRTGFGMILIAGPTLHWPHRQSCRRIVLRMPALRPQTRYCSTVAPTHIYCCSLQRSLIVLQGHQVVVSPMGVYYLRGEGLTWQRAYDFEPVEYCQAEGNSTRQELVLGGEAAMWGEQVDASDIDRAIWPRAAAIGERLWTPRALLNNASAQVRLGEFRCLLNQRGIAASEMGQKEMSTGAGGEQVESPAAFSGLPPGPSSCLQGAVNRSSPFPRGH